MSEESELELRLSWQEREVRRRTDLDSVSVGGSNPASEHRIEGVTTAELPASDGLSADRPETSFLEDEDDDFQWTEERERALEEALEESPEGSVPRVQLQLEAIQKGLESKALEPDEVVLLLSQVDKYLASKMRAELAKPPVAQAELTQSRKDKLNALSSYSEAVAALREYSQSGEEMQLKIAAYATEQGGSFLNSARELLMASEPDYEEYEDEDSDEDDDYDEEDYEDDEDEQ